MNAINSKRFRNSSGSYARRPNESECLLKKMIGKPYSGKPNVRFDEGELEIEPFGYYASSLLYSACSLRPVYYRKIMLNWNLRKRKKTLTS